MDTRRKILHVPYGGLGHGGVSTVIFSIVEALYGKFDFDCVVFKRVCEREIEFLKYGKIFRIDSYYEDGKRHWLEIVIRPWRMFWGIYKICKANNYDVIHCHNGRDEAFCLLAAKCAGVPIRIAHSHNSASPQKRFFVVRLLNYFCSKLIKFAATGLVGCSETACLDFFGEERHIVIPNAVDLDTFSYTKRIIHDQLTFINVGRYTYQKNQMKVIHIFQKINQILPNCRLLLVGFGEDKKKLVQEVNKLCLEKVVSFIPGNQVDVSEIYALADYMIFPSNYEGFGIVLIEAQAMGIPCFVSNVIPKEVNVGLVTFIDLKEEDSVWADVILKYINDGKHYEEMELKKNLGKYDIYSVGRQYASLYEGR